MEHFFVPCTGVQHARLTLGMPSRSTCVLADLACDLVVRKVEVAILCIDSEEELQVYLPATYSAWLHIIDFGGELQVSLPSYIHVQWLHIIDSLTEPCNQTSRTNSTGLCFRLSCMCVRRSCTDVSFCMY